MLKKSILLLWLFFVLLLGSRNYLLLGDELTRDKKSNKTPVDEIILVFKTHFDIGYTDLPAAVIENYRTTMIDTALARVDESVGLAPEKQFVWTIPGWPMAKIIADQPSDRATRLWSAMKQGRFVVHALPFTLHTETLTEEDLVYGLRFSTKVNEIFDKEPPTDAKMTDVPCHSWILPTLLAHSGVRFMHEGTNSGSADPVVPHLYFREGPDGSRVLTMHVNGYGSGIDPPEDWSWKTWLGLIHTGDNHGPPTREEIDTILADCERKYPGVRVRIGQLADFGDAILNREDTTKIPIVRGDMPDSWIHGPMSDPQGQRVARSVHEQLSTLELLSTCDAIARSTDNQLAIPLLSPESLDMAREESLLYGEHTWGGAFYWMCKYDRGETLLFGDAWKEFWNKKEFPPMVRKLMQSWDEHTMYIRNAQYLIEKNAPGEPSGNLPTEQLIFNPLSWSLVALDGQTIAPGTVAIAKTTAISTVATDNETDSGNVTIESPYYRVTLDPKTGRLTSVYDRKRDREIIKQGDSLGFFYQRVNAEICDRFMNDYCVSFPDWVVSELGKQGIPRNVPEQRLTPITTPCQWSVSHDDNGTSLRYSSAAEGMPFEALETVITLNNHRPEMVVEFSGKGKAAESWPEAGYFHFPLAIDSPQFRLGRLGGIVDPAKDIVSGSNRHLFWLRTGVATFGKDGFGVGICPLSSLVVSLGEPGCWKFSIDDFSRESNLYFNLFNNQWTTNFRLWNEGDIKTSFVLWTFDDYDSESSLITPAMEAMALYLPLPQQRLNQAQRSIQGVSLNRKGVAITSFGSPADADQLFLRLWEMTGKKENRKTIVQLPDALSVNAVLECDLRDRPLAKPPIPVVNGQFEIDIPPYSPRNLLLQK